MVQVGDRVIINEQAKRHFDDKLIGATATIAAERGGLVRVQLDSEPIGSFPVILMKYEVDVILEKGIER